MKVLILLGLLCFMAYGCVKRADVIAKAKEWVKVNVGYNQTGTHQGYRTDCSGFSCYAWGLAKPGLLTAEFIPNNFCTKTTKDDLEAGDFLLAPGLHVAIFQSWVDQAKTTYWLMEEAAHGAVRRQKKFPYGALNAKGLSVFFPCKVNYACPEEQSS